MSERTFLFYRCRGGLVGFDTVFVDGELVWLDALETCPLCDIPVAEHTTFMLLTRRDEEAIDDRGT